MNYHSSKLQRKKKLQFFSHLNKFSKVHPLEDSFKYSLGNNHKLFADILYLLENIVEITFLFMEEGG